MEKLLLFFLNALVFWEVDDCTYVRISPHVYMYSPTHTYVWLHADVRVKYYWTTREVFYEYSKIVMFLFGSL